MNGILFGSYDSSLTQLLYAGEGESRKPGENPGPLALHEGTGPDKAGTLVHKGHEFLAISFHMPTNCEVCQRHLWHMFKPPPALECRRKWPQATDKNYIYLKQINVDILDST